MSDPKRRILILGGTPEGSELAQRLADDPRFHPVLSFAEPMPVPETLTCEIRTGGFGGPEGLAIYLRREAIDFVIDATHPFAARMRWNAADACADRSVARLRLERAGWDQHAGDLWHLVPDIDQASAALAWSQRIFLTIDSHDLAAFGGYENKWFLIRASEPPDLDPALPGEIIPADGPFSVEDEIEIISRWRIDTIVSRNSGGTASQSKIIAARRLGIKIVMVERPANPEGSLVRTIDEAVRWLDRSYRDSIGGIRTTSAS